LITVSEVARAKILELLRGEGREGLAVRLAIDGRAGGSFRYRLGFVGPDERRPEDTVIDAGGFELYVDEASAPSLVGTTIHYVETLSESGFKIENPNSPWTDPLASEIAHLIDSEINPAVAAHGGWVTLVDVKDGIVYLELGGGCQGCGMAKVTLRQGIEVRIKEAAPSVREVVDVTDHAGGASPYYASSEGSSPLSG
jgi:Fe/S biogenesis protein NfuA